MRFPEPTQQWRRLSETESTQNEARQWAKQQLLMEAPSTFLWVQAREQSQGRGRQGRSWIAHEGDLILSCAMRWPTLPNFNKGLLTLIAGYSLFSALRSLNAINQNLFLKWPNDLFAELPGEPTPLKKIGGILAESFSDSLVVVGWGVNLKAKRLGESVDSAQRYAPASLGEVLGVVGQEAPDADVLAVELSRILMDEWSLWIAAPESYEQELLAQLQEGAMKSLWGREGRLDQNGERAQAQGLGQGGALEVRLLEGPHSGQNRLVSSGEFTFFV